MIDPEAPDHFTLPGTLRSKVTPIKFKKRRPDVWSEEDTLYVAFNLASKPYIPPYIVSRDPPSNTDLRRLNWVRSGYIYLAFLPVPLEYRGPLLERLRIDERRLPILCVETSNRVHHKLDPKLAESWARLAEGLEQVAKILLPFTEFSANIKLPPRPKCDKLKLQKESKEECAKLIFEIRDAFSPWFALASFCIAVLDGWADIQMKSGFTENHPVWIGKLLASNIHPGWIGWLVNSPLSWFGGTPRLGTIIHFERNPYALAIGLMDQHNVPVVYCLHAKNEDGLPPAAFRDKYLSWYRSLFDRRASEEDMGAYLRKFVPPASAVERTGSSNDEQVLGGNDFGAIASTQDPSDPELEPQSGQRPFETREQFFARREEENVELISRETPEESGRREKRLEKAKKFNRPDGKSTTRVFCWEIVSNREIRCSQRSFTFEMLFTSLYTKEEMKYDAVRDEWDMWRNMKLTGLVPDHDIDYDPWLDEDFLQSDDPDPRIFELDLCEAMGNTHLTDIPSPKPGSSSHTHTAEACSVAAKFPLETALQLWYGFTIQNPANITSHSFAIDPALKNTYDSLGKGNRLNAIFVDSISNLPNPPTATRLFLTHLITGSSNAPRDLSDLHDRSLFDSRRSGIRLLSKKFVAQAVDDDRSPKLPLFGIELVDERGNRVEDRDGRQLFFWNAITVLAILRLSRERNRSVSHIAKYLVELGAAFLMTIPRSRIRNTFQDIRVTGLGRRWRGYKPDRGDFGMYQQKCFELFSIRRIRRALRCGGILWRIALEFIGADEALDGPVYEACNEPLWVCNSQSDRAEYVEDGLSMDEILLLIGSFELCDEKSNNKPVWSSYWPPPWIWESSGYCVGYWTPDCEDWFINRLNRMKDGTNVDPLLCVEDWKGVVKRFRQTKKMTNTLEKHCINIIEEVMTTN
ncbi:hypothetical protein SCHPADRAFT_1003192 [Schizopora paradoxa]|uniref:Uncharacterized protein n=1 Tax=Schizopora paradoxa TaxID=27342 RepID=A0A0H2QYZ8_9AGAM|nr:hypothetical protein SCHPADRAFT_1003192 [Schizopora paradoxa]